MKEKTIANGLAFATEKFTEAGIDTARLDAEVLMSHVLNCRRLALYVHMNQKLDEEQAARFSDFIKKRSEHIPVAYLTGHKEFMGIDFAITPKVLIPRPETEVLAQKTIENLHHYNTPIKIADIGTGSGAICLSILKLTDNVTAAAVDISADALEIAKYNAHKYNLDDKVTFYEGNLFEPLMGQKFSVIVSNPPYIRTGDFETIQAEIKHEPRIALDGGVDGLDCYRQIIKDAPGFLTDDGFLAVEIGEDQTAAVLKLIEDSGRFKYTQVWKDLADKDRVAAAWKN